VHPIRTRPTRQRWLENLISDRQRLVTNAEVLQEILHRYVAINRRDAIQPAFEALLGIAAERAKEIVMSHRQMSARDALHLAIMEQHGIKRILSFDSGLDGFPGITRLSKCGGGLESVGDSAADGSIIRTCGLAAGGVDGLVEVDPENAREKGDGWSQWQE
jgi:uncharacterized protein